MLFSNVFVPTHCPHETVESVGLGMLCQRPHARLQTDMLCGPGCCLVTRPKCQSDPHPPKMSIRTRTPELSNGPPPAPDVDMAGRRPLEPRDMAACSQNDVW